LVGLHLFIAVLSDLVGLFENYIHQTITLK